MKKIGKWVLTAFVMGALITVLLGSQKNEGPAERSGKQIDKAVERAGEQLKKAGDKVEDAVKDADKK
jgi:hypothetical protein